MFSEPLELLGLETSGSSIKARLRVLPATRRVDATLAAAVLALRPTLAQHSCKQRSIGLFGDKIVGSTLPHLVEHLAIDLLVESCCQPKAVPKTKRQGIKGCDSLPAKSAGLLPIAGATRWLDREQGIMQLRVSCAPQSAELTRQAIVRSVELVNSLLER
ncbi:MAG: hypothetical protein LBU48_06020 [Coriobacteriales bacterium]|nr:hypothetical protein [Coriobacteriales bacterium]